MDTTTENAKLRAMLEKAKEHADHLERRLVMEKNRLKAEERSHSATRGHVTRQKKRAAAGVCPCCNRTFKQLARHMERKHPNYTKGD